MSERKTAPVILFTYNRPEHTRNTMEALAANELADKTELYIFSDAAKPKKDESEAEELAWRENVKKVEQILRLCGRHHRICKRHIGGTA